MWDIILNHWTWSQKRKSYISSNLVFVNDVHIPHSSLPCISCVDFFFEMAHKDPSNTWNPHDPSRLEIMIFHPYHWSHQLLSPRPYVGSTRWIFLFGASRSSYEPFLSDHPCWESVLFRCADPSQLPLSPVFGSFQMIFSCFSFICLFKKTKKFKNISVFFSEFLFLLFELYQGEDHDENVEWLSYE